MNNHHSSGMKNIVPPSFYIHIPILHEQNQIKQTRPTINVKFDNTRLKESTTDDYDELRPYTKFFEGDTSYWKPYINAMWKQARQLKYKRLFTRKSQFLEKSRQNMKSLTRRRSI